MRRLAMVVGALCIASCGALTSNEEHAFRVCEGYVQKQLRSPSTYQRVTAIAEFPEPGKTERTVFIEYDAHNAFGVPVRGTEGCQFRVDEAGNFPSQGEMELAAANAASRAAMTKLVADMEASGLDTTELRETAGLPEKGPAASGSDSIFHCCITE